MEEGRSELNHYSSGGKGVTGGKEGTERKEKGKAAATGNGTGCLPRRTAEDSTEPFPFVAEKKGGVNGSFLCLPLWG